MTKPTTDFMLLTPVPIEHFISGCEICSKLEKVTYGSNAVPLIAGFQEALGKHLAADVLFYASHAGGSASPMVTYRARFESWVAANAKGCAPNKVANFRPKTTASDKPWKSFYVVSRLRKLRNPLPICELRGKGKPSNYSASFYPRGPLMIEGK